MEFAAVLDSGQRRAVQERLTENQLARFDLMFKDSVSTADRERLEPASRSLMASLQALRGPMPTWTRNSATQAQVKVLMLDSRWQTLPRPPLTDDDADTLATRAEDSGWQTSAAGSLVGALARR